MQLPRKLGALEERQFRLLFSGQAVSVLGDALVPVAIAFAVLDLTGSASDLGFVLAAQTVPLVAFLLVGGVWADRLPRQLVMLASDVIRGAVQAVLAVLLLTGRAKLWELVVLLFVYGVAEAFFRPAMTGLVPSTVSPARLQQANALLGMSTSVGGILGPALAGVLVATVGPGEAIAVDAATFAVSAYFLARLRPPRPEEPPERSHFLADLASGWGEFKERTWLWVIVLWASFYLFAVVAPMFVLGPLVAKESLGGPSAWALLVTCFSIGTLAGGAIALRYRPSRPMLACSLGVFVAAPQCALLGIPAPLWLIAPWELAAGAAMGFFGAVWDTTLQQHVPLEKLSRVSAYDWMGSLAIMPLGFAIAGPISDAIGVSTTLYAATAWGLLTTVAVLFVPSVRRLRRLDYVPVPEPQPA